MSASAQCIAERLEQSANRGCKIDMRIISRILKMEMLHDVEGLTKINIAYFSIKLMLSHLSSSETSKMSKAVII